MLKPGNAVAQSIAKMLDDSTSEWQKVIIEEPPPRMRCNLMEDARANIRLHPGRVLWSLIEAGVPVLESKTKAVKGSGWFCKRCKRDDLTNEKDLCNVCCRKRDQETRFFAPIVMVAVARALNETPAMTKELMTHFVSLVWCDRDAQQSISTLIKIVCSKEQVGTRDNLLTALHAQDALSKAIASFVFTLYAEADSPR